MENFTIKPQSDVLFRSTVLSVQSAYPCKLKSTLKAYLRPYLTVPHRYLNTCFAACPVSLSRLTHELAKYIHCIAYIESGFNWIHQ
jgi:hypothetical protein